MSCIRFDTVRRLTVEPEARYMNDTRTNPDSGDNSIGLCSIDVIYSKTRRRGSVSRHLNRHWPLSTSHMKYYAGKNSADLREVIDGLKTYADHSMF